VPRTHGSALFTRGQTQALTLTTLGATGDAQRIDTINPETGKKYMHHYNFPPYSVGETGFMRGPKRRDIGHGALAERALAPMLPDDKEFPYTIRLVSEILESNGSSSMASVCGSTLSLMDAGVQIKQPIAGIAMGLIKEGDDYVVLTDIAGVEDHLGDMDFKVAGSRNGITALQMDIKISGVSFEILGDALEQARRGRLFILDKMLAALPEPRAELSPFAPRIFTIQINPDQIGLVIGKAARPSRGSARNSAYRSTSKTTARSTSPLPTWRPARPSPSASSRCARTSRWRHHHRQGGQDDRLRRLCRAQEGRRRADPHLQARRRQTDRQGRRRREPRRHDHRRGRRDRQGTQSDRPAAGRGAGGTLAVQRSHTWLSDDDAVARRY